MSNWMNRAREFLGLGPDPYYDEYDDEPYADDEPWEEPVVQAAPAPRSTSVRSTAPPTRDDWEEPDKGVRVISPTTDDGDERHEHVTAAPAPERNVVRPLPNSKPEVVNPTRFDDVQLVADAFKKVQPVIVNLQGVERDLSRRLIDFASGLCYGLEGEMERVADQVFLLTPKGAQVSDDERRRIEQGSLGARDA